MTQRTLNNNQTVDMSNVVVDLRYFCRHGMPETVLLAGNRKPSPMLGDKTKNTLFGLKPNNHPVMITNQPPMR